MNGIKRIEEFDENVKREADRVRALEVRLNAARREAAELKAAPAKGSQTSQSGLPKAVDALLANPTAPVVGVVTESRRARLAELGNEMAALEPAVAEARRVSERAVGAASQRFVEAEGQRRYNVLAERVAAAAVALLEADRAADEYVAEVAAAGFTRVYLKTLVRVPGGAFEKMAKHGRKDGALPEGVCSRLEALLSGVAGGSVVPIRKDWATMPTRPELGSYGSQSAPVSPPGPRP